jgi:hypothetical protein
MPSQQRLCQRIQMLTGFGPEQNKAPDTGNAFRDLNMRHIMLF